MYGTPVTGKPKTLSPGVRNLDLIAGACLLALWVFESAFVLQGDLRFTADSAGDMMQILLLTEAGQWPAQGILMAALGWDLGPLYFLLVAPLHALWPGPMAVHGFNVTVGVLGFGVLFLWLRKHYGSAAAIVGLLFLTQSTGLHAFMDTVWHVGAAPGVAIALLVSVFVWAQHKNTKALWSTVACLTILVQIHALGFAYVPLILFLLARDRQHIGRRQKLALAVLAIVLLVPFFIHWIPSLSSTGGSAARHSGGLGFRLDVVASGLVAFTQPIALLGAHWGGYFVLLLASIASLTTVRSAWQDPGESPVIRRALLAQCVLGALIVALVIPYENVGRYFLPLLFPFFVLAALGAGDISRFLKSKGRPAFGRLLTWSTLLVALAYIQPPTINVFGGWMGGQQKMPTEANLDFLMLEEQEAVADFLVTKRGLQWPQIRGQVHGVFMGPWSGMRYMTHIREPSTPTDNNSQHWIVMPDSVQEAIMGSNAIKEVTIETRTRTLHLWQMKPNFDARQITVNTQPCPNVFPYVWSKVDHTTLQTLGYERGHGPDIHHCLQGKKDGVIRIPLTSTATSITVQIGSGRPMDAQNVRFVMEVDDPQYPELPLGALPIPMAAKTWYSVGLPPSEKPRTLAIHIKDLPTLNFVDVY